MADFFDHDDNHYDSDDLPKSKTQVKKEMHALQDLGKRLTELRPDQLAKIPISPDLQKAIEESRRIKQREATRRHLQYIGKLMRDEDIEAIQHGVDLFDSSSKAFAQLIHGVEHWRERLIAEGNDALTAYLDEHPQADVQHLRQLVRNAVKDADNEKNTGAAKKLFRYLKSIVDNED